MQWRPEVDGGLLRERVRRLHELGRDELAVERPPDPAAARLRRRGAASWDAVVASHLAVLDAEPGDPGAYWAAPADPLPAVRPARPDVVDMGNHCALRTQRAVFQEWKEDVPWASAGEVTVALGGSIAQETGALPALGAFQPG